MLDVAVPNLSGKTVVIVASIEARMGSTRLPGKVLADIAGKSCLDRVIDRLRLSKYLDDIILATTVLREDDVLEVWAKERGIPCYRGSSGDVLGRVVGAHLQMGSSIVVEITGDCPLTDVGLIDQGLEIYRDQSEPCVVSNCWAGNFPQGIDVQIFPLDALRWVNDNIDDLAVREHVSLYFYENQESFSVFHMKPSFPMSKGDQTLRLQLDYSEDLKLINLIYSHLEPSYPEGFGITEVLDFLNANPEYRLFNGSCIEKPVR